MSGKESPVYREKKMRRKRCRFDMIDKYGKTVWDPFFNLKKLPCIT